jgi:hypothetical protein
MEGVNLTVIYCKNFCKCHNVSSEQQYKKINIKRKPTDQQGVCIKVT